MATNCIPIIEISDENFETMWPAISNAITGASFIALDCELSGLGNRSKLNYQEIDIRYQNTKDIAQEYSVVSLGISCFTCQSCSSLDVDINGKTECVKSQNYMVQTFNILTLCASKYIVECDSLKFLRSHGFDFNKLYSHGLPYLRGERSQSQTDHPAVSVKSILHLIIKLCKPIVLHNGLVDLIFLYQSFYADLPKNVETFSADLLEMFPAGIYDTKYIAEFNQTFSATFLQYIFKKLQLENESRSTKGHWHSRVKFPPYPESGVAGLHWLPYLQVFREPADDDRLLCDSYKYHGWCPKRDACTRSHDIDRIVRELLTTSRSKRKTHIGAADSSVAQLINMKKQKMEKQKRRRENESSKDFRGVTNGEEIVVAFENVRNCGAREEVLNKSSSALPSKDAEDKNFVDITEDDVSVKDSGAPSSKDHENDVTILDDDASSIEEVFDETESNTSVNHTARASIINNVASTGAQNKTPSLKQNPTKDTGNGTATATAETEMDASPDTVITIEDSNEENAKIFGAKKRDANGGHSAGYDAFMTGFIFAYDVASLGTLPTISAFRNAKDMALHHLVGKVYLIGKGFPFLVRSSSYGGTSPSHNRLIKLIRSDT